MVQTAEFLSNRFNLILILREVQFNNRERIKGLLKHELDTLTKQDELKSLRIYKPEPAKNSVEDICTMMTRRRFLVSPTYQRKEVINPLKASAIIESILLGIYLPAIFVYKRSEDENEDALNEVIDGQQRILTLSRFYWT